MASTIRVKELQNVVLGAGTTTNHYLRMLPVDDTFTARFRNGDVIKTYTFQVEQSSEYHDEDLGLNISFNGGLTFFTIENFGANDSYIDWVECEIISSAEVDFRGLQSKLFDGYQPSSQSIGKYQSIAFEGNAKIEFHHEDSFYVVFRYTVNRNVTGRTLENQRVGHKLTSIRFSAQVNINGTTRTTGTPQWLAKVDDSDTWIRDFSIKKSATELRYESIAFETAHYSPFSHTEGRTGILYQSSEGVEYIQQSLRTKSKLRIKFNYPDETVPTITSSEGYTDNELLDKNINEQVATFGTLYDTSKKYKFVGWEDEDGNPINYPYVVSEEFEQTINATWKECRSNIRVKVNGQWNDTSPLCKVNGEWTSVSDAFVKINGEWTNLL